MGGNFNKYALCIGLNKVDPDFYDGWPGYLTCCENDAEIMKEIANYHEYEVDLLKTDNALINKINNKIIEYTKKLENGDILLLYYSGHGTQIPDYQESNEKDYDEAWCLYDGCYLDDQLYYNYLNFKEGVKIIIISDSCYSGGMYKMRMQDTYRIPKYIPTSEKIYEIQKDRIEKIRKEIQKKSKTIPQLKSSVFLLSACQENQIALSGKDLSLFTENLEEVWNNGKFEGCYKQFYKKLRKKLNRYRNHRPSYKIMGNKDYWKKDVFE